MSHVYVYIYIYINIYTCMCAHPKHRTPRVSWRGSPAAWWPPNPGPATVILNKKIIMIVMTRVAGQGSLSVYIHICTCVYIYIYI